jgi:hypothetical protein
MGRGCATVFVLAGVAVGLVMTLWLMASGRPETRGIEIRHNGKVIRTNGKTKVIEIEENH